jgi:Fe2+ transport system protein FeoA
MLQRDVSNRVAAAVHLHQTAQQLKISNRLIRIRTMAATLFSVNSGQSHREIRHMGLISGTGMSAARRAPLKDSVFQRIARKPLALGNSEADFSIVVLD